MLHRLCGPPSIPLSFNLAIVLPRRITYRVSYGTDRHIPPTPSDYRLLCGLPGYLILFDTRTFAVERQDKRRRLPSPLVFLLISAHSTATPGIPSSPTRFQSYSINRPPHGEHGSLTINLYDRLPALYA